ncbi:MULTISPECIES: class II aldolase/adducin family protein [unclassified Streptomyces]|uniref:class II aldolase/adducin family protein n=1 Tax=unclassified Streptomyces TaxID=2593676 RepID=UPI002E2976B2|nr:class II aldolase/adducin family protein [Streptomyces sp. NBC_00223]
MAPAAERVAAAERIAAACRVLGRLGLTREPAGHVSMRLADGSVAVKARGPAETGLRFAGADDVVVVGPDGELLSGAPGLKPPQEVAIHLAVYRARPDVGSVAHVHPLMPVLFGVCDVPLLPLIGAYDPYALRLLARGVPTYQRAVLVTDRRLGDELAAVLGSGGACLMRGHGVTTAGETPEEAALNVIKLSELAELNFRARQLGEPRPIDAADQESVVGTGRTRPELIESTWRFYRRLADEPTGER